MSHSCRIWGIKSYSSTNTDVNFSVLYSVLWSFLCDHNKPSWQNFLVPIVELWAAVSAVANYGVAAVNHNMLWCIIPCLQHLGSCQDGTLWPTCGRPVINQNSKWTELCLHTVSNSSASKSLSVCCQTYHDTNKSIVAFDISDTILKCEEESTKLATSGKTNWVYLLYVK